MLLIIAFGIYVLVKKKVFITRTWILTGDNATKFGAALVVVPILFTLNARRLLPYIVPARILSDPIGGRLVVLALLAVILLAVAFLLRDKPPDRASGVSEP